MRASDTFKAVPRRGDRCQISALACSPATAGAPRPRPPGSACLRRLRHRLHASLGPDTLWSAL